MAKPINQKTEKKKGLFQWLLWLLLSVILIAAVAIVILIALGVDVRGAVSKYAGSVPGVASYVESSDNEETVHASRVKELEGLIAEKNDEIEELTGQIAFQEKTIEDLNEDMESKKQSESLDIEEKEERDVVKELASSLRNMEAESAAMILTKLENGQAVEVLETMSGKDRGEILGAMDPEEAAKIANDYLDERQ
ncbi:MotE family protein [Sediminibacillus massiliensis]|uniref:MotE family protein n=1 Tax=Sediminibacillus massiliensis TaxID=1926277 RepID=UPI0009885C44|nr:hypothetical protein [Sediminibacillus massiliensis]